MRGGYRPGAGRPKGARNKNRTKPAEKVGKQSDIPAENLTPLEFMLKIMRSPNEPVELRLRCAIAACPYCHPRKGEAGTGKKDEKAARAKIAGMGKYASMSSPFRVVK
jgi:phage terminase small subunit